MDDWAAFAKLVLRTEMLRRKMSYADLAAALRKIGINEAEVNVRNKIGRGTYSAAFLLQCLMAMGVKALLINDESARFETDNATKKRRLS